MGDLLIVTHRARSTVVVSIAALEEYFLA